MLQNASTLQLNLKCELLCRSWSVKKMKIRADPNANDSIHSNGKGHGDTISIDLLLALKLYTDYDAIQYSLKQCFRGMADYDLSHFMRWRKLLDFAVSRCGTKIRKNRFFHGVRNAMELEAVCGFDSFQGPLSLTVSLEVARQFATSNGMLLQIGSAHSWQNERFLDVSVLSDFKNEHEVLTMGFTTRIHMVSLNRPLAVGDDVGTEDMVCLHVLDVTL